MARDAKIQGIQIDKEVIRCEGCKEIVGFRKEEAINVFMNSVAETSIDIVQLLPKYIKSHGMDN